MTDEFVITDGTKFLKQNIVSGQYKPVANITMADTYTSKGAAINVFKNSLTKALQRQYYVAQIISGEIVRCGASAPPKTEKRRTGLRYRPQVEHPEITQWYGRLEGVDNIFDHAIKRSREISQELSDVEQALTDIEHFIEFSSLGAGDGYKIYAKQRELLRKRRALKDEQKIVSTINNNFNAKDAMNNILSVIKGLQNQTYEPRILDELFTKGISAIE